MKRLTLISISSLVAINFSLFSQQRPSSFNGPYINSVSNRVYLDYRNGPRYPVADPSTIPGIANITIFPSGSTLLNSLQAAWNFDEQFNAPTNRFSDFSATSSLVLSNSAATGAARSLTSGGLELTNGSTAILTITNTSVFGLNSSFTMSFWVCGGVSGSNPCGIGQQIDISTWDYQWGGQTFQSHDSGGTLHQVVGTSIGSTTWLLVVCGYDSANNQIFISNNGGARVNASAGGSVKQTANMPFRISINPALVDNFYFWNRVLTSAEITTLYNSGFGVQYPFTATDPGLSVVSSYYWGLQQNGGTTTVANSNAIVGLVDGMNTHGLWARMGYIGAYGGSTVKEAINPIKGGWQLNGGNTFIFFNPDIVTASVPFNNGPFVDADVTVNGMQGNGTSKYLNLSAGSAAYGTSGTQFPSWNNCAITVYCYSNSVEGGKAWIGSQDGIIGNGIYMYNSGAANWIVGQIGTLSGGNTQSNAASSGYCTLTRPDSTHLNWYFANSQVPHGLYSQSTVANTTASPNLSLGVSIFGLLDRGSGGTVILTTNRLSYASTSSSSLSSSESANYFSDVQTFLTTKGGGYR